jgi:hypothetical protein
MNEQKRKTVIRRSLCLVAAILVSTYFTSTASAQATQKSQYKPGSVQTLKKAPKLPPEAYVERNKLKKFKCPGELKFPSGTNFTPRAGLKFKRAYVMPSCGGSEDLNPDKEKGGMCMRCEYEANLAIYRSSGPNYRCWVSGQYKNEFTCEYVPPLPPLPPAQTCEFTLNLPVVNMTPYTSHTKGDKDMHGVSDLLIDAEIRRGTGSGSGTLYLVINAVQKELKPDHTTFKLYKVIELTDVNYVGATAADVANCLRAYGTKRPLSIYPKGKFWHTGDSKEWLIKDTLHQGWPNNLIQKGSCRFDTKYDNDMKRVGCRAIWFKPNVTVRLK